MYVCVYKFVKFVCMCVCGCARECRTEDNSQEFVLTFYCGFEGSATFLIFLNTNVCRCTVRFPSFFYFELVFDYFHEFNREFFFNIAYYSSETWFRESMSQYKVEIIAIRIPISKC